MDFLLLMNKNRRYRDTVATIILPDGTIKTKWLPSLKEAGQMLLTFVLAVLGWIIFRADSVAIIQEYIVGMCNSSILSFPNTSGINALLLNIAVLICVEWWMRTKQHGLDIKHLYPVLRYAIYAGLLFMLFASVVKPLTLFISNSNETIFDKNYDIFSIHFWINLGVGLYYQQRTTKDGGLSLYVVGRYA